MSNKKTPGSDGFSAEFYKFFWKDIAEIVCDSINYAYSIGELSIDQSRGLITLIPKKDKDRCFIKNWRPIALLNIDYKMLAKALSNRLKSVISKLISEDQTAYIAGRYIGENIRTVADVYSYLKMSNSYGLVLQIDFEKAFDTINWDFIDKSLCNYNIGISFRKWVKILYTNSKSAVMNNGNFTQFFHLQRGVRQGCPLSAFLFLLVVELLANKIRASNKIKGIKLQNGVLKVSQMADDTTIFLSSIDEVTPLLAVLETFAMCSGLKTNVEKTKVYPINNIDKTKNIMPGLNLEHGPIRLLGLTITCNQKVHFEENIKPKLMLMHNLLNIWSSRNLSLKGKITVINSLIVPLFIYPASIMEIDKDTLVEIDAALFKFLWSNRKPKIAKNVIQGQYKDGGLKMPNIFEKVNAWQLIWLKRAQLNPHRMWVKIIDSIIKDIKFTDLMYTHSTLNNKYVTKLPLFYQKMLTLWNKIRTHDTGSVQSIQSQIIWLNDSVTIEKKIFFWEKWYRHGIVRIKDLLDSNGNFLSPENMQTKYNIRCSFIETLQIRQAIPFQWRKLLRTSNKIHDTSDGICTDSNVKPNDIQYLTSSQIYWALMSAKKKVSLHV